MANHMRSSLTKENTVMDAFESNVAEVLWRDGYWVQNAVKVDLTKDDKSKINRPSSPPVLSSTMPLSERVTA